MIHLTMHNNGEPLGSPTKELFDMTLSQTTREQRLQIAAQLHMELLAEKNAQDKITEKLFLAFEALVPASSCQLLAHHLLTSELLPPFDERPTPEVSLFALAGEKGVNFERVERAFAGQFVTNMLQTLRPHTTERAIPMSADQESLLRAIGNILSNCLPLGDIPPSKWLKGTFKTLIEMYPPESLEVCDHHVVAISFGIMLQTFSGHHEKSDWLSELTKKDIEFVQHVIETNNLWVQDKATSREIVESKHAAEAKLSKKVITKFCELLSLEVHQDLLGESPTSVQEVTKAYESLGTMNEWHVTPALLQIARDLFLPVFRVYVNDSGSREVWACDHLKFFYRVICD